MIRSGYVVLGLLAGSIIIGVSHVLAGSAQAQSEKKKEPPKSERYLSNLECKEPTIGIECSCPEPGDKTVEIYIKPHGDSVPFKMRLDRGYFDARFIPRNGSTHRAMGLYIDAEEFAPWPRDLSAIIGGGSLVKMLVSDYFTTLSESMLISANIAAGRKLDSTEEFPETPYDYGLLKLEYEYRSKLDEWNSDVFIARSETSQITDLIVCRLRLNIEGRYAICRHQMRDELADYKISYSRDLLPRWRELSLKTRKLFKCATRDNK